MTMLNQDLSMLKKDVMALRDEIKLKVHLARMDLRDEWAKLEPEAERVWNDVSVNGQQAAKDLKQRLITFRDQLKH